MTQEGTASAGKTPRQGVPGHALSAFWLPVLLCAFLSASPLLAQHGEGPRGGGGRGPGQMYGGRGPNALSRPNSSQHLPEWFAHHQGLPPAQQEDALRREPGFARLPADQQQRLIDRLHRLDMEPPAQRQRMMERNERFESLPPERQQEIRGASQALSQMPEDRRQALQHAFRDLRHLPPDERQSSLNSARFQAEYSPQERTVLGNLLSIEPYQPETSPAENNGGPRF